MGRLKYEQEFGQKLQDREIKPSESSWDELQRRLDSEEKKKMRFPFQWLSVAACVAGGIFIWSLAFDSGDMQQVPEIVTAPSEEVLPKEEKGPGEQILIASEERDPKEDGNSQVEQIQEEISNTPVTENTPVVMLAGKEAKVSEEPIIKKQPSPTFVVEQDLIGAMEELVAEANNERTTNSEVTDEEVNALLENAAAELALEHHADAMAQDIDAGSLLWEVEMELERSFREKVLDVLKEGYLKTRTAVANQSF